MNVNGISNPFIGWHRNLKNLSPSRAANHRANSRRWAAQSSGDEKQGSTWVKQASMFNGMTLQAGRERWV